MIEKITQQLYPWMMRCLRRMPVPKPVLALAVLLPLTLATTSETAAEVATGCLSPSGRIAKVAVGTEPDRPCGRRETEIVLQLGNGPEASDHTVVPFAVSAAFGEDVDILTHGPITLYARCRAGPTVDSAAIAVVSSEPDLQNTSQRGILPPAGDGRQLFAGKVPSPDGGWYTAADEQATNSGTDFRGIGASAISPDGYVVTVLADTVGFGLGLHRFSETPNGWEDAPDCLITGVAMLFKVGEVTAGGDRRPFN